MSVAQRCIPICFILACVLPCALSAHGIEHELPEPEGQIHNRLAVDGLGQFDATKPNETLAANWQVNDVGFGTKPSFDFDLQGRLHVMGMTEALSGQVWYASAESVLGPWEPQTVSTGYFYGPGDLRVASDDAVHIAWHDHDREDPNHYQISALGEERLFQIPSPGHNGWDNSLALDSQGQLLQGSINPLGFGATTSLELGTFDGSRWTYQSVPGSGPVMYGLNTSVAVDSNDQPHLVYCSCDNWATPGDLNYARRTENGWDVETLVTGGIRGRFPVVAIDERDRSHIAWIDIDTFDQNQGLVRYGILDGDNFVIETVDTLEDIRLGFDGARKLVSLDLDSQGQPHIAFGDEKIVKYAVRSDDQWQTTTVLAANEPTYNGLVVMRLDASDSPAIAFWQPDDQEAGIVRIVATQSGPALQPGDANQDLRFDQVDLIRVVSAQKFLSGEPATWGEGDWNGAPGGSPGNPPIGDGFFENRDVIAALAAGKWLTGSYAASGPQDSIQGADPEDAVAVGYDLQTGSVWLETPDGFELTSVHLQSKSGIFGQNEPSHLDGVFDNASSHHIFKATFGGTFGAIGFGDVAEIGLSEEFLRGDLSVAGSFAKGGAIGRFDLQYIAVPEPTAWLLLLFALPAVALRRKRRRRVGDVHLDS